MKGVAHTPTLPNRLALCVLEALLEAGCIDVGRRSGLSIEQVLVLVARTITDELDAAGVTTGAAQRHPLYCKVMQETHQDRQADFALLDDAIYNGLFGATRREIAAHFELPLTEALHLRQRLHPLTQAFVQVVEVASACRMALEPAGLDTWQQSKLIQECAGVVAPAFQTLSSAVGIEPLPWMLPTPPLLESEG
jgi:hypothetical protein